MTTIQVALTLKEVAIMRSLARVSQKACERQEVLLHSRWETDLYRGQAALHRGLADKLSALLVEPANILADDEPWDGLGD